MLVRNRIPVLLQEALRLVRDIVRVVSNGERRVAEPWLLEDILVLGLGKLIIKLRQERWICSCRETGLFIKQSQDTQLAFDDVNAGLVIGEFDESPVNLLADVLLLLEFEDVCVELHEHMKNGRDKYG